MSANRWRLFWGILFIVIGAIWLWNNLDLGPRLDLGSLWPLILIAIGVYIFLRQVAWRNQPSRGTITDAILGDINLDRPGWELKNGSIFTVIGDVDVDLTRARIPEGETKLGIRSIVGDVEVLVPSDLPVFASASVALGDVRVMDKRRDGFFNDLTYVSTDYTTASRKVRIEVDLLIGEAKIVGLR